MKVELRPDYQIPAVDNARQAIRDGARSVLINSPTGSGKTVISAALMELVMAKGRRANFVVDRLSLVDQTSAVFDKYGLDHGVIQADHPRYRPSMPLQVCSIQTLSRRGWPDADVDLIDEAHVLHKTAKDRIAEKRRAPDGQVVIGLSATPFTRGLGKYFDVVVNVTTTHWLINQGWLVPYRAYGCEQPDMSGVPVNGLGEWDEKETSKRALALVGDVVAEYLKHGDGRKFICSAVDTSHVEELQRQFIAAGINVASYTYKDRDEDRADTTLEFRKPDSTIRGLITVTAASRGFDVPDVGCVIEARPLRKSLAEHIQLLGRGLRIAPGKVDCLVLDHSGNFSRFWGKREAFFADGLDQLDDGKPKDKKEQKKKEVEAVACPSCKHLHNPAPSCPVCGHEYPRRLTVVHEPGTLKEILATGNQPLMRAKLWPQVVGYVLANHRGDMASAQKRAQAIYINITGEFARARIETTTPVTPSSEVKNKIRSINIARAKEREKASAGVPA